MFIETEVTASAITRYRIESGGILMNGDEVIAYLESLPKPTTVRAERANDGSIELRAAATPPARGIAPLDMAETFRESRGLESSALVLAKREDEPQFVLPLSAISLWQRSYRVIADCLYMFREPDDSARSAHASGVLQIKKNRGIDFSAVVLRRRES